MKITVLKPCRRGEFRTQKIKTRKKVPDYWRNIPEEFKKHNYPELLSIAYVNYKNELIKYAEEYGFGVPENVEYTVPLLPTTSGYGWECFIYVPSYSL